jgi:isopenicillin N synthase-like dioxygenase
MQNIPSVDLQNIRQLTPQLIQEIGDALEKWGFVNFIGHGISNNKIQQAYQSAKEVFALSETQKKAYEDLEGGRQRGYTPYLQEKAKNTKFSDLKEFWHIGREISDDHPHRHSNKMRANLFPKEIPSFQEIMQSLFDDFDHLAHMILTAIAHYLGYESDMLTNLVYEGNSILRVLHYPNIDGLDTSGHVRAAAHEDINLLTLLPAATQPGLELLTREGEWLSINPPLGSIICDTGDMMSLLTQKRMPATTHRVVNPIDDKKGSRLSMPFFMHPHPEARLTPLHLNNQELGLTAHEFLTQRLRDNSLI